MTTTHASWIVVIASWGLLVAPAVDNVRGDRELIDQLRQMVCEGRDLVVAGKYARRESTAGWFYFHLGRHLVEVDTKGEDLARRLESGPAVVVITDEQLQRTPGAVPHGWLAVGRGPLGHADVHLYYNPWPPPEAGGGQ